jgi:hypothetical protein
MVMTSNSILLSSFEKNIHICIPIHAINKKSYRGRNGMGKSFDRINIQKINPGKRQDNTFLVPKEINSLPAFTIQ